MRTCLRTLKRVGQFTLAAAAMAAYLPAAVANGFPDHAIRIVVPSSPGGSGDTVARLVAERMGKTLGQSVVVENRGGAGGNIATSLVAGASPDGYTILLTGNNHTVNVSLFKDPPYKLSDFAPVIQLTLGPTVFVASKSAPFQSLAELISAANAEPETIVYGSPGIGLPSQIAAVLFEQTAGVKLVHAPYKGSGPSLTSALGGQIPLVASTLAAAMPYIKGGQLTGLAVTSEERWPSLPDIPTVAESGYPGFSHLTWLGLLAPAGTPPAVLHKLHDAAQSALDDPDLRKQFEEMGTNAVGGSAAGFQKMMDQDYEASKALIQRSSLKAE